MDLKSIVSIKKIEDNVEYIGLAAGLLSDFGLQTPIEYARRYLTDGPCIPSLEHIRYFALDHERIGAAVKGGAVMAIGGAIGGKLLGGLGGRAARVVEKFGTGLCIGGIGEAVILSTQRTVVGTVSNPVGSMTGQYSTY